VVSSATCCSQRRHILTSPCRMCGREEDARSGPARRRDDFAGARAAAFTSRTRDIGSRGSASVRYSAWNGPPARVETTRLLRGRIFRSRSSRRRASPDCPEIEISPPEGVRLQRSDGSRRSSPALRRTGRSGCTECTVDPRRTCVLHEIPRDSCDLEGAVSPVVPAGRHHRPVLPHVDARLIRRFCPRMRRGKDMIAIRSLPLGGVASITR